MPYILKKYYPIRNILFALGEGTLIFLVINAVFLLLEGQQAYKDDIITLWLKAAMVTCIFQTSLYYFDLYDQRIRYQFIDTASRITMAFGFGCILLAIIYYFVPSTMINTKIFGIAYLAICGAIAIWRGFYVILLAKRIFTQPIIILGTGRLANNIAEEINNRLDSGYKIVAHVTLEKPQQQYSFGIPVISPEELPLTSRKKKVEKIIAALDDRRGKTPIKELLACKMQGISIEDGVYFYELQTGKIMVENMNPTSIIFSEGFKIGRLSRLFKRTGDFVMAITGLVLTLPLSLLTALLIKLDSPGPIFFLQNRTGQGGKPFKIIKFRSMRADAEKDGPKWASENDHRVSKFGGFIRKVRLDEIPQLWNVLIGEMSLVGPRPEQPFFVEQLEKTIPYYALRHSVRPGITGWAQVFYPYGASEEDALRKLEYDLYYIKNINLWMDFWIIFQTIKIVLFRKGSR